MTVLVLAAAVVLYVPLYLWWLLYVEPTRQAMEPFTDWDAQPSLRAVVA